ncbi:mechanosensitive ion channel family protein [Sphingomonas lutea]|uniref:Mechanosensitive ion channel family protein n=1 Tax=Sphingomonas lutea TaxID=1045317 RepID=A0A7G9SGI9_9SPHN|nr:mechanosensitive ion channel family protein [Sphingomonas lutea]QNN66964.1 mechanosensitive ion channel family protein [Sphingomonas lutea]
MNPNLAALRQTPNVIDWLIANREGVLIGALVALGIVGVMLIVRTVGQRMVAHEAAGDRIGWRGVVGRVLARTTVLFMVMAAIDIVATYAQPPARAQRLVDAGFIIAFALQGAIWARELILALIAKRTGNGAGEAAALSNAHALIRVLVSVILFALAIVVILDNLGVNVTALVAGLGIGGIAIGLAAQGIFSDLFAALAILFDKPFRKGDTIRFDQTVGRVEQIGLKTTRMRSLSGEQIIMANTKLLEREIHNLADGRVRRITIPFGIRYETPTDKLARMEEMVTEVVESVKGCKPQRCTLVNFGASSLDYQLVLELKSLDPDKLARDRAAVMLALIERFAAEGIEFAYPVQIAFNAAPDGSFVMPYNDDA